VAFVNPPGAFNVLVGGTQVATGANGTAWVRVYLVPIDSGTLFWAAEAPGGTATKGTLSLSLAQPLLIQTTGNAHATGQANQFLFLVTLYQ
jgi:hypothetical protein